MSSDRPSSLATRSSFRLIGAGLAATILLVLCVLVVIWRSHVVGDERRSMMLASEEILNLVEFYGTSTTRFREAAITTGDQLWADAHLDYAHKLEATLALAQSHALAERVREGARRADSLNQHILQLETRAVGLALSGQALDARAIVDAPSFARLIHEYGDALLQFARASDVAGGVGHMRQGLSAMEDEVELLQSAREQGIEIPAQVLSARGPISRRILESARLLGDDFGGHQDAAKLVEAFGDLAAISIDGTDGYEAALHRLNELTASSHTHLDAYERAHDASRRWDRLVMPALLTLLLLVLALVWVRIVRLVRRNLEQQKRAMEQVREAELRADALIEAIPDLIFLHDAEGNFLDYRASDDDLLIKPPDFVNRNIRDVLPPHVATPGLEAIKRAAATQEVQLLEYELEDGRDPGIYEARLTPIDSNRVLVMVRNVTQERRAERAQREAELRFRTLVEHSLVGIYMIQNGRYLYVNPQFGRIVGRKPEEVEGMRVIDLIHPDDRRRVEENLRRRISGEIDHIHYLIRGLHASGSVITVDVYGASTLIDGEPAIIGTLLDVTERERARREISDLKAFYEETLNRLPIEIAVLDRELRYVYLNPLAAPTPEIRKKLLGRTLEDYFREHNMDLEAHQRRQRWVEGVVRTGQTSSMEETIRSRDGRERHTLRVAAPVKDDQGEVRYVVGYALDVSERKEYERKLLDAKERAEEMAHLKSAFLANMSHEIRTPLTGIMGFASLLEDEVPPEQQQFASLIVRSGKRLLDTLNAVLDLSRLEAGEMKLEIRSTDLGVEANEITSFLRSLAAEKGIALTACVPEAPVRAMVDPGALHIVLNNLIGNAIKFTDDGEVRVELSASAHRSSIRITDTGVGIDETFIPQLFEEFKQESIGLTRSHEGAGLGLAITRKLVTMMDGTIEVSSTKGRGTTFEITFPRAPEQLDLPLTEIITHGNGHGPA